MDTSRAEVERLRAALEGSQERADDIRRRLDDIQRIRVIRLRLHLARGPETIADVARATGMSYPALYRKLGLWADRVKGLRLEPDEETQIVAAADLPTLDRWAPVERGNVTRLLQSKGVEITAEELAEAVGAGTAAGLFEGGHLSINESGHVVPGRSEG